MIGGRRVRKSSTRVRAYGDVDELNSLLGVAAEFVKSTRVQKILRELQRDLFVLGSELASEMHRTGVRPANLPEVTETMLSHIEKETDQLHEELPLLRNFILPGGSLGAALLHLARSVARRAEREVTTLSESEAVRGVVLRYMNRLSSLLFELARFENYTARRREEVWSGRSIGSGARS